MEFKAPFSCLRFMNLPNCFYLFLHEFQEFVDIIIKFGVYKEGDLCGESRYYHVTSLSDCSYRLCVLIVISMKYKCSGKRSSSIH